MAQTLVISLFFVILNGGFAISALTLSQKYDFTPTGKILMSMRGIKYLPVNTANLLFKNDRRNPAENPVVAQIGVNTGDLTELNNDPTAQQLSDIRQIGVNYGRIQEVNFNDPENGDDLVNWKIDVISDGDLGTENEPDSNGIEERRSSRRGAGRGRGRSRGGRRGGFRRRGGSRRQGFRRGGFRRGIRYGLGGLRWGSRRFHGRFFRKDCLDGFDDCFDSVVEPIEEEEEIVDPDVIDDAANLEEEGGAEVENDLLDADTEGDDE